jgi:hypothetical protein
LYRSLSSPIDSKASVSFRSSFVKPSGSSCASVAGASVGTADVVAFDKNSRVVWEERRGADDGRANDGDESLALKLGRKARHGGGRSSSVDASRTHIPATAVVLRENNTGADRE